MSGRAAAPTRRAAYGGPRPGAWVAVALVLLLLVVVRLRLLDIPLERDEGEYAYAGQLILHGIPPYRLIYNMKLPGAYAAYALILALFGQTARGVHLGFLLVAVATTVLMFMAARRLLGARSGAVAAATCGLLSLNPSVLGLAGHSSHLVVLCGLAGLLALLAALDAGRRRDYFWSGLLFGLAFLMKQHGLAFVLFGVLAVLARPRCDVGRQPGRAAAAGLLVAGAAVPLLLTCLVLAAAGVFPSFWFWAFRYASAYAAELTPREGTVEFRDAISHIWPGAPLLWGMGVAGLGVLLLDRRWRPQRSLVGAFALCSFLAICPGLYFRLHYFLMLLPAVALLVAVLVDWLGRSLAVAGLRRTGPALAAALFVSATLVTLAGQSALLFRATPVQVCRALYDGNPFPEARDIARHIAARSSPGERIAVLGSEPEICFYANRLSATGHIYMYGLMERQPYARTMQRQAIREIEASAPAWVVLVNVPSSWALRPWSERAILDWYPRYVEERYRQVGLVEIRSPDEPWSTWGDSLPVADARSPLFVRVFRRKSPA